MIRICIIGQLSSVSPFVVVKVTPSATAAEDSVGKQFDLIAPEVEDALALPVEDAPEAAVEDHIEARRQQDDPVSRQNPVALIVANPNPVRTPPDVAAVPKLLPIVLAVNLALGMSVVMGGSGMAGPGRRLSVMTVPVMVGRRLTVMLRTLMAGSVMHLLPVSVARMSLIVGIGMIIRPAVRALARLRGCRHSVEQNRYDQDELFHCCDVFVKGSNYRARGGTRPISLLSKQTTNYTYYIFLSIVT